MWLPLWPSIFRHVQQCGLQHRYSTDNEFPVNIRMLIALAFIPAEHVWAAFDALTTSQYSKSHSEDFENMLDYFENTWFGVRLRRRIWDPWFPIKIWNCYLAEVNDEPLTNNAVEGWYHAFNGRVEKSHTAIFEFINALKQEQAKQK